VGAQLGGAVKMIEFPEVFQAVAKVAVDTCSSEWSAPGSLR